MRDLLIVGAMRAGTTSLYRYLAQHPEIAPSRVKETHYYSDDLRDHFAPEVVSEKEVLESTGSDDDCWFHHARIKTREVYEGLFPLDDRTSVRMEASPSYLPSTVAPKRIAREASNPLIVAILRNPYERIVSHYKMNKSKGVVKGSLLSVLRAEDKLGIPLILKGQVGITRLSLYADDVQRLIDNFGLDQIVVLKSEGLQDNRKVLLREICNRVDIPYSETMFQAKREYNPTRVPRLPWVNQIVRQSGILKILKASLPTSLNEQLANLYYRESRRDLRRYQSALQVVASHVDADLDRLSNVLGEDFTAWRRCLSRRESLSDISDSCDSWRR